PCPRLSADLTPRRIASRSDRAAWFQRTSLKLLPGTKNWRFVAAGSADLHPRNPALARTLDANRVYVDWVSSRDSRALWRTQIHHCCRTAGGADHQRAQFWRPLRPG